jgi:hypothetical protein
MVASVIGALRANLAFDATSFNQGLHSAAASLNRFASTVPGMARNLAGLGGGVQNTARQFTDMAVQMQMSTPVAMIISQQVPQLAAGFGVLGEVLGAVIAIGALAWFTRVKEETKTLKDELDALDSAGANLISSNEFLSQSLDELTNKYGENAAAIRNVILAKNELAEVEFLERQRTVIDRLIDTVGDLGTVITGVRENWIDATDTQLKKLSEIERQMQIMSLRKTFDIGAEEAESLLSTIQALTSAEGIPNISTQAGILAEKLLSAVGGMENLKDENLELYKSLLRVSQSGFDAAAGISSAGDAARVAAIQADIGSASWLAYGRSVMAAMQARQRMENFSARIEGAIQESNRKIQAYHEFATIMEVDEYRKREEAQKKHTDFFVNQIEASIKEAEEAARGGGRAGGGGGLSELDEQFREMQQAAARVFEETRTPLENYMTRIQELHQLLQGGFITWDTYRRGIVLAEDELRELGEEGNETAQTISDAFQNGLADILKQVSSFKEAFANILADIGGSLIDTGLTTIFEGIKFPGFAKGIGSASGGLAWVGERGPELMNVPRGSSITPVDQLSSLGTIVNYAPVFNTQGADSAAIERLRADNQAQFNAFKSTFQDNVIGTISRPRFRRPV